MGETRDDDIELLALVSPDTGSALNANPDDFAEPVMVKRVTVKKSKLQKQLEEMATTAGELVQGWTVARVRLDEVSFTLQVGVDGVLRWIIGAGVSGAATVTFKIDPPGGAQDGGITQARSSIPGGEIVHGSSFSETASATATTAEPAEEPHCFFGASSRD